MSLSLQSGTRWFKGIPDNRVWWLLTVKICWITKFGFKGKLFLLATNLVFAFFLENVSEATRPGEIKMICLSLPHYRTFTLHRFLNENCPTNKIIGHSKFCCKYKIPVISCLPGLVCEIHIFHSYPTTKPRANMHSSFNCFTTSPRHFQNLTRCSHLNTRKHWLTEHKVVICIITMLWHLR